MPALDQLARDGIVFERAMSVAPVTLPAHTSLFTGLVPARARRARQQRRGPRRKARHARRAAACRRVPHGLCSWGPPCWRPAGAWLRVSTHTWTVPRRHGLANQRGQRRAAAGDRGYDRVAREIFSRSIFFLDSPLRSASGPTIRWSLSLEHFDPYVGEILAADAALGRLMGVLEAAGAARQDDRDCRGRSRRVARRTWRT